MRTHELESSWTLVALLLVINLGIAFGGMAVFVIDESIESRVVVALKSSAITDLSIRPLLMLIASESGVEVNSPTFQD